VDTAASLVAEARRAAGLSRRALAARTGVPTSTVSRIESGHMDPTVTMLHRVIAAAGRRLDISATTATEQRSIADLSDAWSESPAGPRIDWTRIRGLLDWLYGDRERTAQAIELPPTRSGLPMLDSLLAGIAEKSADDAGLERPRWAMKVPALSVPWLPPGTPRMIAAARRATPRQLAVRNIWLAELDLWRPRG
jgi:transcriptional regulator with XRE-family HTH domain